MPAPEHTYLFFRHVGIAARPSPLSGDYSWRLWRPTLAEPAPATLSRSAAAMWWWFHRLHVFSNRDYSALLIESGGEVVHRSMIFPGFFRFPFQQKWDLQVGDTWTMESHRNRGLAAYALAQIVHELRRAGRGFWYVVEEHNLPSIRAVERAGFAKLACGRRCSRFGLRFLGFYSMNSTSVAEHRA